METIHVLQEDIDYAVRQHRWRCAIVRAIQRQFPDSIYVRVDKECIAWSEAAKDLRYVYKTPAIAINKIIKPLDRGETCKPITFKLADATVDAMHHRTASERRTVRNSQRIKVKQTGCATNGHARNRFSDDAA